MNSDRWRRIDDLFAAALELDESALPTFLAEQCAGDPELRAEVESMLRFADTSKEFLETPVFAAASALTTIQTPLESASPLSSPPPSTPTTPRHAYDGNARFVPGDVVASRYRIVGLLGRGGMGEVYRADDLKLGQPVALKFLAESLSSNGAALARFHREVSLARQISHRNVCRVYDIGEHAGTHFLSMEYVPGEELSSLLKRIGRLPLDKALDVARQLCAGLAAIHAAGVLHRDLKPANVMIDDRGDVRITDFGVAALSEGISGREAMIGTPAYMAPEQLEGRELTTRSDLYALGLVLYEAFTGNRPFAATSLPEIVRLRLGDTALTSPSSWVTDLDPLVERVILRCLEKDPERRPSTALQVAAALPGGDPLAAALAAGETPSPQMVAAASTEGSMRPLPALLLLLSIFAGFVIAALLADRSALHRFVPLDLSPEVLRARAVEIARDAGQTATPADSLSEFREDHDVIQFVSGEKHPDPWARFRRAPLPVIHFWYRSSPAPLVPPNYWDVDLDNPPNDLAGMMRMRLDTAGRLLFFEAAPPQFETAAPGAVPPADWSRFFEHAGLNVSAFRPAAPQWTPSMHTDARFSWSGVHPARPDLPLRIEAASYRGAPVWFEVIGPWQKPRRQPDGRGDVGDAAGSVSLLLVYFGAMLLAALLAWKNVRLGRGDRRGTFRLVLFIFFLRMFGWIFMAVHVADFAEVVIFVEGLKSGLYWSILIGLLYLAVEPLVRRRWPEGLISWSRLLGGDVRDPLIGRHILIGGALAILYAVAGSQSILIPLLLGRPIVSPAIHSNLLYEFGFGGVRGFFPLLVNQLSASILFPLMILAIVLFFAMLTRRNRVGLAVSWVLFYIAMALNFAGDSVLGYLQAAVLPTLLILSISRYGLLTLVSLFVFNHLWAFYPNTTDLTAWYATTYLLQLALLTALTLYAFRIALAGQKVMTVRLLDE